MTSPPNAQAAEPPTQFDYLLNAYDDASRREQPAEHGYPVARLELLAYVRDLEAKAAGAPAVEPYDLLDEWANDCGVGFVSRGDGQGTTGPVSLGALFELVWAARAARFVGALPGGSASASAPCTKSAWQQGASAFRAGLPQSANPHQPDRRDRWAGAHYISWSNGYAWAKHRSFLAGQQRGGSK